MRVEVLYPRADCNGVLPDRFAAKRVTLDIVRRYYTKVYEFRFTGTALKDACEEAFERCNMKPSVLARIAIKSRKKEVDHTSMSVGDVVRVHGRYGTDYMVCDNDGWLWLLEAHELVDEETVGTPN